MYKIPRLMMPVCLLAVAQVATAGPPTWFAGRWNATRYRDWNHKRDHPLTIALRVEVFDADTDMPLPGTEIRLEGKFREDTHRPHGPLDGPELQDFLLRARTDRRGIAVFGLSWQDEKVRTMTSSGVRVLDKYGKDDIFKVQDIIARKQGYAFAHVAVDWFDQFAPPHRTNTDTYIGDGWLRLIQRMPDAKCVLIHMPSGFDKFGQRSVTSREFFEKIRRKDHSRVFDRQVKSNFDWNPRYKPIVNDVGPYMVLPVRFYLKRVHDEVRIQKDGQGGQGRRRGDGMSRDRGRAKEERRAQNRRRAEAQRKRQADEKRRAEERGRQAERQRMAKQRAEQQTADRERQLAEQARRHSLGLAVETLTSDVRHRMGLFAGTRGVVVRYVVPSSPATRAGIRAGMVIESVDHRAVADESAFESRIRSKRPGSEITIGVWRRDARGNWSRARKMARLPG